MDSSIDILPTFSSRRSSASTLWINAYDLQMRDLRTGQPRDKRSLRGVSLGHWATENLFNFEIGAWEGLNSHSTSSWRAKSAYAQQICQAMSLLSAQHFQLWGSVEHTRRTMRKHRGNSSLRHIQTSEGVLQGQQTAKSSVESTWHTDVQCS